MDPGQRASLLPLTDFSWMFLITRGNNLTLKCGWS